MNRTRKSCNRASFLYLWLYFCFGSVAVGCAPVAALDLAPDAGLDSQNSAAETRPSARQGRLLVKVIGHRSLQGSIRLALFDSPSAFPEDLKRAVRVASGPVEGRVVEISLDGLAFGDYAVAIYHDENNNDRCDRNFLGIPTEQYGFSNGATATFSAPDFDEAKVRLTGPLLIITIDLSK